MKRTFMILGAVAFLFAGCQKDELAPAGQGSSAVEESVGGQMLLSATLEQQGGENGGTKTYLSGSSVYWTAGDAIKVYNSAGDQSAVLTAKTGGDSKTTFSGTGSFAPLYAIYPSGCNPAISGSEISFDLPAAQNYTENTFSSGANVTVGKVSGSSISFKNVCGALKLTITSLVGEGTIDHIKIVANSERLKGRFKVDASSATPVAEAVEAPASEADRTVIINCAGTDGATIGTTPKTYYAILPVNALKGGFTVYVCNADETWAQPIDASNKSGNNTIKRSTITKMPTFDVEVGVIDLSIKESANCYMVNKVGKYRFMAVRGNDKSDVISNIVRAADYLTTPNMSIIKGGDRVYYKNGFVYFETTDTYNEGSSMIAVLDDNGGHADDLNGHTLWSWHIWQVGENVVVGTETYGSQSFMDRNLGADRYSNYGFLYQWGRKDPFMNEQDHTGMNSPKDTYHGSVQIEDAVKSPMVYISGTKYFRHWCTDANRLNLWGHGSSKTKYDPCPAGYRVPENFNCFASSKPDWPKTGLGGLVPDEYSISNKGISMEYWTNQATDQGAPGEGVPEGVYVGICMENNNHQHGSYCVSAQAVRCEKIQ